MTLLGPSPRPGWALPEGSPSLPEEAWQSHRTHRGCPRQRRLVWEGRPGGVRGAGDPHLTRQGGPGPLHARGQDPARTQAEAWLHCPHSPGPGGASGQWWGPELLAPLPSIRRQQRLGGLRESPPPLCQGLAHSRPTKPLTPAPPDLCHRVPVRRPCRGLAPEAHGAGTHAEAHWCAHTPALLLARPETQHSCVRATPCACRQRHRAHTDTRVQRRVCLVLGCTQAK